MSEDAVIIGRFQPMHEGHQYGLIEPTRRDYDRVIIGIGVSTEEPSCHDPLLYEERARMIEQVYDDIETVPIYDQGDDTDWQEEVEATIDDVLEDDSFTVVTGNDWVASCLDDDDTSYDVSLLDEPEMYQRDTYSGTEVRERASRNDRWHELLDDAVATYLDDIGFEQRLTLGGCYDAVRVEA